MRAKRARLEVRDGGHSSVLEDWHVKGRKLDSSTAKVEKKKTTKGEKTQHEFISPSPKFDIF